MASFEPGVIAYYAVPVLTAALAFVAGRYNKGFDVRTAAESAFMGMMPQVIKEQNERIDAQSREIARLWDQLRDVNKREQHCQSELSEQRHQLRDQQQKIIALEHKLGIARE